ncbi:MAG TPA: zf-HC2 domain-containing protein [Actinomycetes bacterium]|jgi:anti-sigma factor RsiW|nr:zf-HC2 domain-containing protein [Actinomycetes bacterium]
MTCEEFRERLTAFSLGELDPHEAVAAREHVARCSPCASSALLDRQLAALVRSSSVPTPPAVRDRVIAALRRETTRDQGRPGRRRHWLALGAAVGLAGALLAATILVMPVPRPASPLEAAWVAYRDEPVMPRWDSATQRRLFAVIGPVAATPDLGSVGFHVQATGSRTLANHLAAVTEYRDEAGRRVTLIRWKGDLPDTRGPSGAVRDDELEAARWGQTGSVWWRGHGIVYCLIGGVDQHTLDQAADQLRSLKNW